MVYFCPQCWREAPKGAAQCRNCGQNLERDALDYEAKLVRALRHPVPEYRAMACQILTHFIPSHSLLLALSEAAEDADASVREAAISALGRHGDVRSVPLLERHLETDHLRVRRVARLALEAIRRRVPENATPSLHRNSSEDE